jgi:hypothetical protein
MFGSVVLGEQLGHELAAARDADLLKDRLHAVRDGVRREAQLAGDIALLDGQPDRLVAGDERRSKLHRAAFLETQLVVGVFWHVWQIHVHNADGRDSFDPPVDTRVRVLGSAGGKPTFGQVGSVLGLECEPRARVDVFVRPGPRALDALGPDVVVGDDDAEVIVDGVDRPGAADQAYEGHTDQAGDGTRASLYLQSGPLLGGPRHWSSTAGFS